MALDFHTSLRGNFIEGMSTIGGLFKVFCTLFGESKEADVSGHNMPFFFLVGSLHFLLPSCDATDSLKPDELNQSASCKEGRDKKHCIRHALAGKCPDFPSRWRPWRIGSVAMSQ